MRNINEDASDHDSSDNYDQNDHKYNKRFMKKGKNKRESNVNNNNKLMERFNTERVLKLEMSSSSIFEPLRTEIENLCNILKFWDKTENSEETMVKM